MLKFDEILSPEEVQLSNRLYQKIATEIRQQGSIPTSRYIELALYDGQDGYYNNLLHKFGHNGDFITSPNISNLFALCMSVQIKELWQHTKHNILEIGSGNGQLMLDLLHQLKDLIEHYYIVEISANLVNLQKQQIKKQYPHMLNKIVWLDCLPTDFEGVILANEVLDAQPCEVIMWENNKIYQQMVALSKYNDFIYTADNIGSQELLDLASSIEIKSDKYISEINLNNRGFVKSLSQTLKQGTILLIDYGYSTNEYYSLERNQGTLRGFFRHHLLDNILCYPGLIDITSNVDFSAIAVTAINNQLDFIGYTTQANFLLNCGLVEIMHQNHGILTNADYLKLSNQVNYLTAPDSMGEIFKVIGFSKNMNFINWLGFSNFDRSHSL